MKRKLSTLLALTLALGLLASCGPQGTTSSEPPASAPPAESGAAPSGEVKLLKTSMPTSYDESHGYTQAILHMNEYLEEVSGGTLKLDLYAGGQLGDEVSVFENMQMGTIDCAIYNAASLSNFTHALEAFDLPYLWVDESGVVNQELQNTVVSSDLTQGFLDKVYQETSVKPLAFLYNPSRDFFLNKPLTSLADASAIKLRSMTAQMHLDMYTAMGFVATPMGYSEVYNAMQTHVVDGFEDTACSTITSGTYETAKYVVKSGHATASPLFVCGGKTWDSLTAEQQGWLLDAAVVGRQACYDTFDTAQENAYQTFEEKALDISVLDIDAATKACAGVIAKYCEQDSDFKSVYEYVQEQREALGMKTYWGMEEHMSLFGQ